MPDRFNLSGICFSFVKRNYAKSSFSNITDDSTKNITPPMSIEIILSKFRLLIKNSCMPTNGTNAANFCRNENLFANSITKSPINYEINMPTIKLVARLFEITEKNIK